MGRNPKIRINFDGDVQYLLRLKHALDEDREWPREYLNEVTSHVQSLIFVLMKAPKKGSLAVVPEVQAAPKKRARG